MKTQILNCKTFGELRALDLTNATDFEKQTVAAAVELSAAYGYESEDEDTFDAMTAMIAVGRNNNVFYATHAWDATNVSVESAFDCQEDQLEPIWWDHTWDDDYTKDEEE
jgi:hypothetical protein